MHRTGFWLSYADKSVVCNVGLVYRVAIASPRTDCPVFDVGIGVLLDQLMD